MQQFCTLGSVRGEVTVGYGEPKRARCRKRPIQPRGYLGTDSGFLYSELQYPVSRTKLPGAERLSLFWLPLDRLTTYGEHIQIFFLIFEHLMMPLLAS